MVIKVTDPNTGLQYIRLSGPGGCSAKVQLYGGQVTSWKNERGEELLFLSAKAVFKPPKAIRGGIPICFPQFGNKIPNLEQHGFARNSMWEIEETGVSSNDAVDLMLRQSADNKEPKAQPTTERKGWPYDFELRLRVALGAGGHLKMTARVKNIDSRSYSFTFAFHTYLSVSDINEVRVEGLETLDYLDNLKVVDPQTEQAGRQTEQGDAITFDEEIDRVYLSTPSKIAVIDHEKKRTFVLLKDGLPDAVVWNPWERKAKAMPDFVDDEYKCMLCVEAAAIEKSISLKPGEEWRGYQELSAVSSSYSSGQLDPTRVLQA